MQPSYHEQSAQGAPSGGREVELLDPPLDLAVFGLPLAVPLGSDIHDSQRGHSPLHLEAFHLGRIVSSFFSADSICFGDSEGLVLLIEGEVVRRRFSVSGEEFGEDEIRSEMRKKLRRLRG